MVVTTDVPEAIRQALYNNWNLHGSLSKKSIGPDAFNTGTPAPVRHYPSIEIVEVITENEVISTEWWFMQTLAHIHVWERPKTTEKKALASAKNNRRYLVQEVKRILHKLQVQLEDIEFATVETEVYADQYYAIEEDVGERDVSTAPESRGEFPVLHTIIPVRARQWHNATLGGFQVNR